MQKQCGICGSPFEAHHGEKYCCEACRRAARRTAGRKFYSLHKEACRQKACQLNRLRKERLSAAGMCIRCGREKPLEGKQLCFGCALKHSQAYYRHKEREREKQ
ncbi:MAG: hypothetical protein ACI4XB_09785 [Ruminococcus sp.]